MTGARSSCPRSSSMASAPSSIFTTTATAGAASRCWKPSPRRSRASSIHALSRAPGRSPPEDVGGPWGYGEFLEAIADKKHERHAELLERCGGDFDPQHFDIDEINRRLASLAPRKSTRRKTAKSTAG